MTSSDKPTSTKKNTRRRSKYSIADIIRSGLMQGKSPDAILQQVKRAFPDAKTTVATIHNYRSQLRKQGHEVTTIRVSSRQPKTQRREKKATITQVIRDALLKGLSNDQVLVEVKNAFPNAKTSRNTVVIQRSALRREGVALPSSWEANRASHTEASKADLTVAIASDHAGVALKNRLKKELKAMGFTPVDLGTKDTHSVDYPDYATLVADAVKAGFAANGVLICGSGIGMSMAANRHRHVRAALCTSALMAKLARAHNNANVLVLGARLVGEDVAVDCLKAFFAGHFEGGRHQRRVDKFS